MYKVSCECCGKMVNETVAHYTEENLGYCPACTTAMSQACTVCGDIHPIWEMSVDDEGAPYCDAHLDLMR